MKKILLAFLFLFSSLCQAATPLPHENPALFQALYKNLELQGQMAITDDGFVYLDLDDRYILDLNKYLGEDILIPPYFGKGKVGAHVTVALKEEFLSLNTVFRKEWEKPYCFEITGLKSVMASNGREIWLLEIHCPALEAFRESLGLSPKIFDHEFHITVGIRQLEAAANY